MNSKDFVKKFTDISISKMCEKNNISQPNLSSGTSSDKNYDIIREEIELAIADLYEEITKDLFLKYVKGN